MNYRLRETKNWDLLGYLYPNEKGISEKLDKIARKFGCTNVFIKLRDLQSQFRFNDEEAMDTSAVVYEVSCNDCNKIYKDIYIGNSTQLKRKN